MISKTVKTIDNVEHSVAEHSFLNTVLLYYFAYKPITRRQILDSTKLKEFADDNFKFEENGRKISKQVENTRYEQFLLFPQYFQKACFPGAPKGVIVWEWVNRIFF